MEAPQVISPTPAPSQQAIDNSTSRVYLRKAFRNILIIIPFTTIAAILCLANLISYGYNEIPEHLCKLTDACTVLPTIPVFLFAMGMLAFVPILATLDHFLAASPTFQDRLSAELATRDSRAARWSMKTLEVAAYISAVLWAIANGVATTSAALIVKYDAPFDQSSDPKLRTRVYVGLAESVIDLLLVLLLSQQAQLFSRASESLQLAAQAPNVGYASEPAEPENLTTPRRDLRTLWDRRTVLDKTCLCLLMAFGTLVASVVLYSLLSEISRSMPSTPIPLFFYGSYYSYTAILIYPLLFKFHSHRIEGTLPGPVFRGFACSVLSLFAVIWALVSTSFIVASVYSLFCDPEKQEPGQRLGCPTNGAYFSALSLLIGVLDLLLMLSLGGAGLASWRCRGVQLQPDSEQHSESVD